MICHHDLSFYNSVEIVAATFAAEYPSIAKAEGEGARLTTDQMSVAAAFVACDQRSMGIVMPCRGRTGNCNSVFVLRKAVRVIEQAKRGGPYFFRQHQKLIARCTGVGEKVGVRLNRVSLATDQAHQTTAALAKMRGRLGYFYALGLFHGPTLRHTQRASILFVCNHFLQRVHGLSEPNPLLGLRLLGRCP